jgi:hypothetical protein
MPAHQAREVVQWCHVVLGHGPSTVGGPALAAATPIAEDLARLGGEEGVPGPALPALERFQQEAVRPAVQFGEGGDRSVTIQHDLAGHRHHAAAARLLGERSEGGHCGAATI